MAWPIALAMMAGTAASMLQSSSHGSNMVPSWGDLNRQGEVNDFWSAKSEQRALDNSKNLFQYQNVAGPQFSAEGYRRAGINPIFAGNYQSTGSFSPSGADTSIDVAQRQKPDMGAALLSMASALQEKRESDSRQSLNQANATAVAKNAEINAQLADVKAGLMRAQTASELEMPAYKRAQVNKIYSDILINDMRRDLMQSQISLNNQRTYNASFDNLYRDLEQEYRHNSLQLQRDKFEFDKNNVDTLGAFGTRIHLSLRDFLRDPAGYLSAPIVNSARSWSDLAGRIFGWFKK